jgi:hypothetical protein
MDGERGPIRRDCASQPRSVPGAKRPDMAAIGGRTGLGVSNPVPVLGPTESAFSEPAPPAKLCSNGLGSMSSFEHA